MIGVVQLLNSVMNFVFDVVFFPFQSLSPLWGMVFVSLLTGILMLWIFGKVSNQEAIRKVKSRIMGNLLGVMIFQSDIRVTLGLQGRILRDSLTYMRYSLAPMLVMMIPVILIIIQLNLRFSVAPLPEDKTAIVKAHFRSSEALAAPIELEAPEGVVVETPAVRMPSEKQASWRVRGEQPGKHEIQIVTGNGKIAKQLTVGSGWGKVSAQRTGKNALEVLLWPGEKPIDRASPIESIEVLYPAQSLPVPLLGWDINWLIWFFVLSIIFGFAFKGIMGVQI